MVKESCRSEISRSGAQRQFPFAYCLGGVAKSLIDVLELKVGIRFENLLASHAVGDHTDDRRDRNTQTPDTRHSAHLLRVDCDPIELHRVACTKYITR